MIRRLTAAAVLLLLLCLVFGSCASQKILCGIEETYLVHPVLVPVPENGISEVRIESFPAAYKYRIKDESKIQELAEFFNSFDYTAHYDLPPAEQGDGMTWVITFVYSSGEELTLYYFDYIGNGEIGYYDPPYEEHVRFVSIFGKEEHLWEVE